nr:hypothetical protein [Tanacetum cinerariifolium]
GLIEKLGDFSVQKGFVRDVTMEDVAARKERLNKVDIMKSTLFPRQAVRIFQNPNSSTRSNNRIPNLGMESVRDKSILRNKEGLNDDGHATSYSYSHAGKSSIPTSFGESTFVSTMNPSSDNPIDVEEEAWLSKATGGVDGPTGAQSGMFPSLVEASDLGNSDPLESRVKGSTNIDDTIHVDEAPIVQPVIIQDMPNSYAGAARGSKPIPSKSKTNFRSLFLENLCDGANVSIPKRLLKRQVLEMTKKSKFYASTENPESRLKIGSISRIQEPTIRASKSQE